MTHPSRVSLVAAFAAVYIIWGSTYLAISWAVAEIPPFLTAGGRFLGAGLVFVAATDDARLRALSAATGEELWVTRLERRGNASPMTYLGPDGRQYLAVAATDEIVAFRLP